ncbi:MULTISPECIES: undecaprenyldiphospho-muramoylpentapeptide beta-N-acetylglucosaminyltransferase [Paeniglutamicibacter]|jgi:UDP-N-acetylglucosamine--N-acetylmuramyl-(pentapeptide) pyrophosphoryl-undecaprenol N-acetylglucosamine transferase|uniref:UDP-N-acetylglucosamine--N-acetylmuramyl-(pentapeptide) pyrophosphoryl-undecaprenol N-acetylglucosamine transferase n=1 Tax=Paeniglutamicibacter sulfureus TaxID=43666 RepID=A0ABU2BHY1_9MICC|nr:MULTISPECIES: undecaprenyldiphospho-muramoylpentapeptide beta-N-acetylglucosaminyltransferase [Paeniglutamicibacter]MCV9995307.1 undecaprenyldiphospho-muramoylpentapeptide beta-N-acetylglucosaminyltransferase [Paeniglutamicibacter sp. ZC-3]MDO2932719.1 undecaprenyldiphospho-muramoylpentapeptide beta-N-acetylglucosaminyltransferase [Paeniglutamicibacter sulfureus]MDR7356989.1 UDP-N-acetylglucosamine--N-acetylmuramyl-(pentapeptide) pyrophosphoryl-undecaprenol N-acetylglucosamine transferase [Pa
MTEPLRVVIAGGGTAGHITPMIAIADALRAADPNTQITAVGTASGLETRLVPEAGYELRTIAKVPMPRRPSLDLLKLPLRFRAAIKAAGAILDDTGAQAVLGVGGYVCTPVYLAARKRKLPVFIHEANARAGLANKVGARFAAGVGTAFNGTGLPGAKVVGMPMRGFVATMDRAAQREPARRALGLTGDAPALVVTGGSSGAASINATIAAGLPQLADAGVQVLHITGRGKVVLDAAGNPLSAPGYRQVEYVDSMDQAYAAADLMVARSGAGTVCELAVAGTPSVLVPLPIGNGEQRLNASDLVAAGGALVVDNADFTTDYLATTLLPLLRDPQALAAMGAAAKAQGRADAAQVMASMIRESLGHAGPQQTANTGS